MKVKSLFILTIIVLGVLLLVGVDETSASSLTTSLALFSLPSGAVLQVKFGCKLVNGQLICGKKNGNAGNDNGNDGQGSKKEKKNKETGTPGERSCPEGYVVLKEKNKYGSFCEPKEGLPETPKEVICKFPGQVGDDCHCPNGTEFLGFRGCVAFTYQNSSCKNFSLPDGAYNTQGATEFANQCQADGGSAECKSAAEGCCCKVKVYAK